MRILDLFRNMAKAQQERGIVADLKERLRHIDDPEGYRREFCVQAVTSALDPSTANPAIVRSALLFCHDLLTYTGHLYIPPTDTLKPFSMAEAWKQKAAITAALAPFENPQIRALLREALSTFLCALIEDIPPLPEATDRETPLAVPLYTLLDDLAVTIQKIIQLSYRDDLTRAHLFERLRDQFQTNVCLASGIDPERADKSTRAIVGPTASDLSPSELLSTYLAGTPFLDFLQTLLPFSIPFPVRFEHTHIVGGSGHGKTQLLQHLILRDLGKLQEGPVTT